jgi:hypothetical protein
MTVVKVTDVEINVEDLELEMQISGMRVDSDCLEMNSVRMYKRLRLDVD